MNAAVKTLFCLLLMLITPALGFSQSLTGRQILEQVDQNLQPGDLEMYRKIINIEPDGKKKGICTLVFKKGPGQGGYPVRLPGQ